MRTFKSGKGKLKTSVLSDPLPAKEIRQKLQLSQSAFAGFMGVSIRTIQDWEQGRRAPQGSAKALLRIAEQCPEVFQELR
nr:type II toxin-antitoxin system MqsA family antitoxin [Endozoicomonas ascidiicola]